MHVLVDILLIRHRIIVIEIFWLSNYHQWLGERGKVIMEALWQALCTNREP